MKAESNISLTPPSSLCSGVSLVYEVLQEKQLLKAFGSARDSWKYRAPAVGHKIAAAATTLFLGGP